MPPSTNCMREPGHMKLSLMGVRYELVDEHCALITIDRPAARNAVDAAVARGIEEALDRAEADDGVRVAVITGARPSSARART